MEITQGNINSLFISFDTRFKDGFEKPPSYYEKLATITRSSSTQTVYPFLGRTGGFKKWVGERTLQNLEAHSYTLTNEHWEDSVAIDLDTISDDQYGIYGSQVEYLGWQTKMHPDVLLFSMLKAATTGSAVTLPGSGDTMPVPICYDGLNFFNASHPAGPQNVAAADTTFSNITSSGGGAYWYIIDAARPIKPFIFQLREEYKVTHMNALTDEAMFMRKKLRYGVDGRSNVGVAFWQLAYASNMDLSNPANYGAARAAMRSIKGDDGLPFGALSTGKDIFLLVPPSLEEVGRQLLNSEFMAGVGSSASVPTTNIWRNSADLIVSEYLA